MKQPKSEILKEVLDLVVRAEKLWRSAWDGQIPSGPADAEIISSGLSAARQSLEGILRQAT